MMHLFQAILLLHTIYIIENLEDMIMTRQDAEQLIVYRVFGNYYKTTYPVLHLPKK